MRRLLILLLLSSLAYAEAGCLDELKHTAQLQRACLVTQSKAGECDAAIHNTAAADLHCQQRGYAQAQTTYAIQEGFAAVVGDPARSPYRLAQARLRQRQVLLDRLDARWERRWAKVLPQVRDDGFDDNRCPLAFMGQTGRYVQVADVALNVHDVLGPELGSSQADSEHLYVAPMREGLCFGPSSPLQTTRVEADNPEFIYNLSDSDLDLLRQGTSKNHTLQLHIHVCSGIADCLAQAQTLQKNWLAYQKNVQYLSAAQQCRRYASANASGEIDVARLYGVDCSKIESATRLQQAEQESQAEAQLLFGP